MQTFTAGTNVIASITNAVDASNNSVSIPAGMVPAWSTDQPAILSLTPVAGTLTATGTAQGSGTVTITATIGTVSGSVQISVAAGVGVLAAFQVSVTPAS